MGRWRGETFKEYIREQLSNFSAGMSKKMKQKFNFVNVCAGAHTDVPVDITSTMVVTDYDSEESE